MSYQANQTANHRYGCRCWQCNEKTRSGIQPPPPEIRKPEDFGMPAKPKPAQKSRRPAPKK